MNTYMDPSICRQMYEERIRKAARERHAEEVARRNKQNRPSRSYTLLAALGLLRVLGR